GRDRSGPPEDDAGPGRAALQDGIGCPQGADRLRHRLQPSPSGDAGGEPAAGVPAGPDQLRGCLALAVVLASGDTLAGTGGQPASPGPSGAAVQETTSQEIPLHDPSQIGPAASPARGEGPGLTRCHPGIT